MRRNSLRNLPTNVWLRKRLYDRSAIHLWRHSHSSIPEQCRNQDYCDHQTAQYTQARIFPLLINSKSNGLFRGENALLQFGAPRQKRFELFHSLHDRLHEY
jgi:hypothetical protein